MKRFSKRGSALYLYWGLLIVVLISMALSLSVEDCGTGIVAIALLTIPVSISYVIWGTVMLLKKDGPCFQNVFFILLSIIPSFCMLILSGVIRL